MTKPVKFPELENCKLDPKGVCAGTGCEFEAYKLNLEQAGNPTGEDRVARLKDLENEYKKVGCIKLTKEG